MIAGKKEKLKAIAGFFLASVFGFMYFVSTLPFPELLEFRAAPCSTVFLDRNGKILQVTSVDGGIRREHSELKDIPPEVRKIFIEAEDKRFFYHFGVDPVSVVRAGFQNAAAGRTVSGASTLSMQLAGMIFPSKKHTFFSKIRNSFCAMRIESALTKRQILSLYFNRIPFGYNVEGISSASRFYFGCPVDKMSREEILCLAVIPRNPDKYAPFRHSEECALAASRIPSGKKSGYEKILSAARKSVKRKWPFEVPHEIERIKSGKFNAGGTVVLECDIEVQKLLENSLSIALESAKHSRIKNCSALVIENATGNVVAYCGSNSWFDDRHGGKIDGVTVKNQMGSSMKPFLYALAVEKGIASPASVIPDIPMEFGDRKVYIPANFNNRFHGPVLFRTSLASSLNIGAVSLLYKTGVDEYLKFLVSAGFCSLDCREGREADLGLALGAGEVTLEELVRAFSIFPNDGILRELRFCRDDAKSGEKRVVSSDSVRVICDILRDRSARTLGFGYSQSFMTSYQSVFKTGTANQYQNIVAVGAVPRWTVGVWMGNFDGNTVVGKTGSSLPASCARSVLDWLVEKYDAGEDVFPDPDGWEKRAVCSVSGMKFGENCTGDVLEFFRNGEYDDSRVCSWHRMNSFGEPELVLPAEYQEWLSLYSKDIAIDYSTMNLEIKSPAVNSVYYIGPGETKARIPVRVFGGKDTEGTLEVILDGEKFEVNRPFNFSVFREKGPHEMTVVLGEEIQSVFFSVK